MRKFYSLLIVVLLTTTGFSQTPQKMSYQAVIRNSSDQLVTNHAVGMRISILKDAIPAYVETHTPISNTNGLVSIEIGGGTPVSGTLSGIDWSAGTYFIKTEMDPTGGTGYNITGTSQLISVPYAFYSKTSESSSDAVKLTGDQTIAGNKTFTGTTTVISPVNPTDAVNKAYVDELKSQIEELQIQIGIEDIDANIYKIVKIGTQMWMKENLRTSKYNDGTDIPNVTDNSAWASLTTGAYSDYSNNSAYSNTYGRLYNWYAVDNNPVTKVASNGGKNICPTGWHVPSDAEWTTLIDFLGGTTVSGGKLKETGTGNWTTPNAGATNETGFTALPGGYRIYDGTYYDVWNSGFWWSSTENSTAGAWCRGMFYGNTNVVRDPGNKRIGFSVRCIKD